MGWNWRFPAVVATTAALVLIAGQAVLADGHAGYDVSWPQCGRSLPSTGAFGIVGVNGGRAYETNDCLAEQYRWATTLSGQPAFYINTGNPGTASKVVNWYGQKSPNPNCSRSDEAACAYNYGYNGAKHAYAYAQAQTGAAGRHTWWLDVETTNSWSDDAGLNTADILGAIAYLRTEGVAVGVYSTRYQWGQITAGARFPDLPNWVAGARDAAEAPEYCGADSSFTGGPVVLVQWVENDLDHNYQCAPLPVTTPMNPLERLLKDLLALDIGKVLRDLGVPVGTPV
jgi:hypothetical protein